jgi:hypothetical protein
MARKVIRTLERIHARGKRARLHGLTQAEDKIFEKLLGTPGDDTFRGRLYRDGVPRPDIYLAQPVRVVFVFREPNLGKPYARDMRAELRDPLFRATREVALFAHAVVHALNGADLKTSYQEFQASLRKGQRPHDVLLRFGYMQIKKVGGGASKPAEIERHARTYGPHLKNQLLLYEPHVVVGCGRGPGSPARLLQECVFSERAERRESKSGLTWWRYPSRARTVALLEADSPSARGSAADRYRRLAEAFRELAKDVGLLSRPAR